MFFTNIERDTLDNDNYRKTVYTDNFFQLVLMSLKPKENIHREAHVNGDQFIRIEQGECKIITDEKTIFMKKDDACIIPSKTYHEVVNIGNVDLKLYTLYSPPQHSNELKQHDKPIQECEQLPDDECTKKYIKYQNKNI
jgi:mannose-6-phosphate isomerase-like protein (cupin superfamily)